MSEIDTLRAIYIDGAVKAAYARRQLRRLLGPSANHFIVIDKLERDAASLIRKDEDKESAG